MPGNEGITFKVAARTTRHWIFIFYRAGSESQLGLTGFGPQLAIPMGFESDTKFGVQAMSMSDCTFPRI